ncbi:Retrovirus-related Pol polyprotein from transposon TNT 1-94 [Dendrobium catenatum]|uniref:Retrovirus-related Pol polyprotein from transposon TNT 1-94 n=1 Tax=Dendrobium catenatum TaxID=906689 RepID=A0A2I0W5L4_9ASPA|nr:Retrovirus-related Pol polyprotein from transposon TNT 1-94 [Dendrobium catenatum]
MGDTAFSWSSQKQPVVDLSTCEVEYVAASSCVCHAIWLRKLLKEIGYSQVETTKIYVDNKSAIALSKNPVYHKRNKHIDVRFHYIRDHIKDKEVQVEYVKSEDQIADIFTKPLAAEQFIKLKILLGVVDKNFGLRGSVGNINQN